MNFSVRLLITVAVIVFCAQIGKKYPSLAGLIATMPLAGLIVLIWLYSENPGNNELMVKYTRGAMWGILPCIGFYLVALFCFQKHLSLQLALLFSFAAWLLGALTHHWLVR